jgi:hypothetical protein
MIGIFLLGRPSLIGVKFARAGYAEAGDLARELMKQVDTYILVDFMLSSFTGALRTPRWALSFAVI